MFITPVVASKMKTPSSTWSNCFLQKRALEVHKFHILGKVLSWMKTPVLHARWILISWSDSNSNFKKAFFTFTWEMFYHRLFGGLLLIQNYPGIFCVWNIGRNQLYHVRSIVKFLVTRKFKPLSWKFPCLFHDNSTIQTLCHVWYIYY